MPKYVYYFDIWNREYLSPVENNMKYSGYVPVTAHISLRKPCVIKAALTYNKEYRTNTYHSTNELTSLQAPQIINN